MRRLRSAKRRLDAAPAPAPGASDLFGEIDPKVRREIQIERARNKLRAVRREIAAELGPDVLDEAWSNFGKPEKRTIKNIRTKLLIELYKDSGKSKEAFAHWVDALPREYARSYFWGMRYSYAAVRKLLRRRRPE